MKYYFFTGAAGYIGSHTAYCFLKKEKCKIVIYDNLSTGFYENIAFLKEEFSDSLEFIQGDLSDKKQLNNALLAYPYEAIVHFAASLIVKESMTNPLLYFRNNVANTINLLEGVISSKIPNFLFSSTAAVYGEPTSNEPILEDAQKVPINPYGESKLMIEKILLSTQKAFPDFRSVILRYFNVAGALMAKSNLGQRTRNATHLIKVACECACNRRPKMEIFGTDYATPDGTCIRDYIHIDDLANAHFESLKTLLNTKQSQIYNVGYKRGFSVKEVIECVKKVSGVDFQVDLAPRRLGDPAFLVSNNEKILQNTAWKPQYDNLETICKSAYLWEKKLQDK